MAMAAPRFVPKQAITKDVDLYAEITANSTKDVARAIFRDILNLPNGLSYFKIHDNGCGAGEVTSVIMETATEAQTTGTISIEATDIDDSYLDHLRERVKAHQWPVTVSHMAAEASSFGDATFDISIANFVVFLTPDDGIPAVEHMRRTLKPGGTAIFTAWSRLPHVDPVRAAHLATRGTGPDVPSLREIPPQWWLGSHLKGLAIRAGFEESNIQLHSVTVYIMVHDEQHLARVLWSYLGPPVTGWLPSDERNWDTALQVIAKSFEEVQGFERLDSGVLRVELMANVIVASS